VNGLAIADNASVVFTPVPTIITGTITSTTNTVAADGISTATIVVTLKDQNDAPVAGAVVEINTTVGTLSDVVDNGDGTYTALLTSSITPGTAVITFSVDEVSDDEELEITFTPVNEQKSFFIPEGFSPDDDGVNDTFVIDGVENMQVSLKIFNRWGVAVYESSDYKNDWAGLATSGVLIGERLPDGTYFYIVDLNNGEKPFIRSMTIKRK
jgi:gliding motility-associated-like protein